MEDTPPSHPGPDGNQGPLVTRVTAANLTGHMSEVLRSSHPGIEDVVGHPLVFDDRLSTWDKAELFFLHGYDDDERIGRGALGPSDGRFYVLAEPGIGRAEFDDRLAAFLREHSFGPDGVDGGNWSHFGRIGGYNLDIVHYNAKQMKTGVPVNTTAPHNVDVFDLGRVARDEVLAIYELNPHNILDLTIPYNGSGGGE